MEKIKNRTDNIVVQSTKYIGLAVLLALICWGAYYGWNMTKYEQTNDAQIDAYLSPINVKVGGYITKIYFKDNQKVKKGDTLLLIDNREFHLDKMRATADFTEAKARLSALYSTAITQTRNIEVEQGKVASAKVRMEHQTDEFKRFRNLLNEESTTRQQFDNVSFAYNVSKTEYATALNSLKAAEARRGDIQVEAKALEAAIQEKETVVAKQNLTLEYTAVIAPFDGQLGKKNIQEGQLVQAGQTLAFLLNENEDKWVVANFKETQVGGFTIGQKVRVIVDAFPNDSFNGEIESLSPTTGARYSLLPPDNATGNFVKIAQRIPVRIRLTDDRQKTNKLAAGMNTDVFVIK